MANGPARIVVGVDGSPGSAAALDWAIDEAALRSRAQGGVGVHAVLAWQYHPRWTDPTGLGSLFLGFRPSGGGVEPYLPSTWETGAMPPSAAEMGARQEDEEQVVASQLLEQALAGHTERAAQHAVSLTGTAVEGHPAHVLLQYVTPDDLLVVGSRGHGQFAGTLLGSISQHVVNHARCPVVVVRGGGC
ncbi:MAG TPA: universal stress protein [Jatrophihabitans sp.]|nr:universal stress protein [Jatrophihabitans sp.]